MGGGFVADPRGRRIGELHSPAAGGQYFFTNATGHLGMIEEKAYPQPEIHTPFYTWWPSKP